MGSVARKGGKKDQESPVTNFEVDQDAETFENYHFTNPDHGQGAFALSWRAGSEKDNAGGFVPLASC